MDLPKFLKAFLLVVLTFSLFSFNVKTEDDCDSIRAKTEIESVGSELYKVKVVLLSDTKEVKYIFCEATGKVLNNGRFNENELGNLKKGNYFCLVNTPECTKKIDFKID